MDIYSRYIKRLTQELAGLPGVGAKSAQRLAFYIVNMPKEKVLSLSEAILEAKENTTYCRECLCLTDSETCPVCSDLKRDHSTIMVVEAAAASGTPRAWSRGRKGTPSHRKMGV